MNQSVCEGAVFWDIENEICVSPETTCVHAVAQKIRRRAVRLLKYLRSHFVEPCTQCCRVYASEMYEHFQHVLQAEGFSVNLTGKGGNAADHALRRDIADALSGKDGLVPLPPVIVLLSGDKHFAPIIRELKRRGHRTWLFASRYCTHRRLVAAADLYVTALHDRAR
jgi:NYN domain-containing protein